MSTRVTRTCKICILDVVMLQCVQEQISLANAAVAQAAGKKISDRDLDNYHDALAVCARCCLSSVTDFLAC